MARTYVVTGTASGIGATVKRILEERGYEVIGVDIHDADVVADLGTREGRLAAADKAVELANGHIDAAIACAGLGREIAKTVSVNYFGTVEFLNALAPTLAKADAPRAALISSIASLFENDEALVQAMCVEDDEDGAVARAQELADTSGGTRDVIYASTKRAICRWVRRESITARWAGAGIPLNAVGPGIVRTPMTAHMIATEDARAAVDQLVPMPLNHYLEPEQVAYLLIWLTSEENTHISGQTIYIDGGADASMRGENIW